MSWRTVRHRDRRERQSRTQRFCRTVYRLGVPNRFPVGKYYIDPEAR
jgi:hypothetical protein